ncbi:MAG: M20/M25/M40 family metallo-hydrolase [Akkermansia sp.]
MRGGKIYARGATDNKGQLFAHILGVEELLRQNGGHLPVNVIFLLEGEEEVGSGSLSQFIKEHREELACDVIVVSDTGMAAPDTPTFSYGLRGLAGAEIIVNGPSAALRRVRRSGGQPIAALAEIIASFHDEEGA